MKLEIGNRLRAVMMAALLMCGLCATAWAYSAWPIYPMWGLPLGYPSWDVQEATAVCSDGAGGAIVAWEETFWTESQGGPTKTEVRLQRVDRDGLVLWTPYGIRARQSPYSDSHQTGAAVVSDGAGGAIVVWHENENNDPLRLVAQRFDPTGAALWGTDGIELCAGQSSGTGPGHPAIVADGSGGAIVSWAEYAGPTEDAVRAQRLSAAGVTLWTAGGVEASTVLRDVQYARTVLCTDGTGGAILGWIGDLDVYAQHLDASGARMWSASGEPVRTDASYQHDVDLCSDGAGGAVLVWVDHRNDPSGGGDLYGARVTDASRTMWGVTGGIPLAAALHGQGVTGRPRIAPGSGGWHTYVTWAHDRDIDGEYDQDIYVQCVTGAGTLLYGDDALAICTESGIQQNPELIVDEWDDPLVVWEDQRGGDIDLYARRAQLNGAWTTDGIVVASGAYDQHSPALCADETGSAIVAYAFGEMTSWGVVYTTTAQRVDAWGALGDPAPQGLYLYDTLDDEGGVLTLGWDQSYLDSNAQNLVSSYWLWREVPAAEALAAMAAGAVWSEDHAAAGAADRAMSAAAPLADGRLYTRTVADGVTTYWEYVGAQPAQQAVHYQVELPTPATRSPGGDPVTRAMVQAHCSSGTGFWNSKPVEAVAVDNLAPAMPGSFAGTYDAGTASLHWSRNTEADFADYRLHRGDSEAFVPVAENLIATLVDTGYVDVAGAPRVYKLVATDVHGNGSEPAVVVLGENVGVTPATPGLAFGPLSPNPATMSARLAFTLPRSSWVRLEIFDAAGRSVRALVDRSCPAGTHEPIWDLRDSDGRPVPAGLYFVRLGAGGAALHRRIAVTR